MSFINIPASGGQNWKQPVADASSLPITGNSAGDSRVTLDTSSIYVWDALNSSWVLAGGGASAGYNVQPFTLTPTDISNKFVTLPTAPTTDNLTQLTVIGGPLQDYGVAFTVTGTQVGWAGLFLDGVLGSGDKLVIIYN